MLLSNSTLRQRLHEQPVRYPEMWGKRIIVRPLDRKDIQPCSLDVHIGDGPIYRQVSSVTHLNFPKAHTWEKLRIRECATTNADGIQDENFYVLEPGELYLAATYEYFEIPSDVCGQLRGISTMGRMGFVPHKEAGLLDPGWKGNITLEIEVMKTTYLIPVYRDTRLRVGQVTFEVLDQPAWPAYRGRYQGDMEATPAKPELPPSAVPAQPSLAESYFESGLHSSGR